MNRKILALAFVLPLAFTSCSQAPVITPPSSTVISAPAASGTPSSIAVVNRGVAAAEQALTLAYRAALVYTGLPRCGTGLRICSDVETVRKIRSYAIQAHNALIAARENEANIDLVSRMWVAIEAFRAIVPAS